MKQLNIFLLFLFLPTLPLSAQLILWEESIYPWTEHPSSDSDFRALEVLEANFKYYKNEVRTHPEKAAIQMAYLKTNNLLRPFKQSLKMDKDVIKSMYSINAETILIHAYNVKFLTPKEDEIMLYDSKNNTIRWRTEVDAKSSIISVSEERVVFTDKDNSSFSCLDLRDGSSLWTKESTKNTKFNRVGVYLITLAEDKKATALAVLNLKDGTQVWQQVYQKDSNDNQDAELIPTDAATFIFRLKNQIALKSIAEGKSFWQVELPEDQEIKNIALLPGNNLVVTSRDQVQMLDGQNGSVAWVFEAEDQQILNVLVTSSKLILSTTVENSLTHQLRAFDLETKMPSWTYALGTTIKAPILQSGQHVLVSTFDKLIRLDLDKGKLVAAQPYPLWFQLGAPQRLDYAPFQADLIRRIDQNIYVSRSTGLVAFQGEQLNKWFEYPAFESYIYTPQSLNKRFVFEKEMYMGADPEKEMPDFFGQQTAYFDFQNQNLINQIADNQRTIDASLRGEAWADNSDASFLMAYNRELKDTQRSLQRIEALGNFITTGINGAIAVLGAIAVRNTVERVLSEIEFAAETYQKAFSGKYYIRPFYSKKGAGFHIVDLETASFTVLYTGPAKYVAHHAKKEHLYNAGQLEGKDLPTFDYNANGNELFFPRFGHEAAGWEGIDFERFLSGIDLGGLSFEPIPNTPHPREQALASWQAPQWAARGHLEKTAALLNAEDEPTSSASDCVDSYYNSLIYREAEQFQYLINAGFDINTQDETGKTALIKAVIAQSTYAIKSLLNMGANPTLKDNSGQGALEYAKSSKNKDILTLIKTATKDY